MICMLSAALFCAPPPMMPMLSKSLLLLLPEPLAFSIELYKYFFVFCVPNYGIRTGAPDRHHHYLLNPFLLQLYVVCTAPFLLPRTCTHTQAGTDLHTHTYTCPHGGDKRSDLDMVWTFINRHISNLRSKLMSKNPSACQEATTGCWKYHKARPNMLKNIIRCINKKNHTEIDTHCHFHPPSKKILKILKMIFTLFHGKWMH